MIEGCPQTSASEPSVPCSQRGAKPNVCSLSACCSTLPASEGGFSRHSLRTAGTGALDHKRPRWCVGRLAAFIPLPVSKHSMFPQVWEERMRPLFPHEHLPWVPGTFLAWKTTLLSSLPSVFIYKKEGKK